MPRLIFNAAARRELIAIAAYVGRVSADPMMGQKLAERLTAHCIHLAGLPVEMGRPRPELGRNLRSSVHEGHIIVFRYQSRSGLRSHLIVVHILNGRRNLSKVFTRLRTLH